MTALTAESEALVVDLMWNGIKNEATLRDRLAAIEAAVRSESAPTALDVERLAKALMHVGVAAENVSSIGTAEQWVPDIDAARKVAAAYAALPAPVAPDAA